MNEWVYRISVRIRASRLFDSIAKVEKELGDTMASFGVDEKPIIVSSIPNTLTVNRELTSLELQKISEIVTKEYRKHFGSEAEIEEFTLIKYGDT